MGPHYKSMSRLKIVHYFIITCFIIIILNLFYLQFIKSGQFRRLDLANRIRLIPQPGSRGAILDRNGLVLVDNRPSFNLYLLREEEKPKKELFAKLSSVLGIKEEMLQKNYQKKYSFGFLPVLLAQDIGRSHAVVIEELKSKFPQLFIQIVPRRMYREGAFACHLLGYVSKIDSWRLEQFKGYGYKPKDEVGFGGVEEFYDYLLHPEDGGMQVEVDHRGRISRVLGVKEGKRGADIFLTIDLRIQRIAENALNGKTGAVVILDPRNGEILGLCSFPEFNPSLFVQSSPVIRTLLNDPDAPLFNRAVSGTFPAGSIFKMIVAAAGLETKTIDAKTAFFCRGAYRIGNRQFQCWKEHGRVDLIKGLAASCNVFFYNLGLLLGPAKINQFALKFGLGRPCTVDLPAEAQGKLPYSFTPFEVPARFRGGAVALGDLLRTGFTRRLRRKTSWFDGDTANFAIGQGEVLVTPLQAARMAAVFANGGRLIQPHLLRAIKKESSILKVKFKNPKVLPLRQSTLNIINQGLHQAVCRSEGTAHILSSLKVDVAGKTGTAQVTGGSSHSWFVGYFPKDNPRFVICVLLEHGGSGYNACLVTKEIIQKMLEEGII